MEHFDCTCCLAVNDFDYWLNKHKVQVDTKIANYKTDFNLLTHNVPKWSETL